ALEVDHLLAVGDRLGALTVGDAADELVGRVDEDEDAQLPAGVAPALGEPGSDAGEGARHETAIVIRVLTGAGPVVGGVAVLALRAASGTGILRCEGQTPPSAAFARRRPPPPDANRPKNVSLSDEFQDVVDDAGVIEPGPVAGAFY